MVGYISVLRFAQPSLGVLAVARESEREHEHEHEILLRCPVLQDFVVDRQVVAVFQVPGQDEQVVAEAVGEYH